MKTCSEHLLLWASCPGIWVLEAVGSCFTSSLEREEALTTPVIPSTLAVPSVSVALLCCFQHGAHWGGLVNTKSSLFFVQLPGLKCGQCFCCLLITSFGRSSKRWAGLCDQVRYLTFLYHTLTYQFLQLVRMKLLHSLPTGGNCPSTLYGMCYG